MFKEILQIIPRISSADLKKMTDTLGKRFSAVAKKFGKGLGGAIAGGGILGMALGFIDKLLNPIKEVQEAMDRTLKRADDISTFAKQFGTTSDKLAALTTFGKATGLDEANLYTLIEKFQASVSEAAADPTKQTAVRQYVNDKDTAESFFDFIQTLQGMDKNQQIAVQQEVFGEKQILRMSDFLNANFAMLNKQFNNSGAIRGERANEIIEKGADLNDRYDRKNAFQSYRDLTTKIGMTDERMIDARVASEQRQLDRENKNLANYQNLEKISAAADAITATLADGIISLTQLVTNTVDIPNGIKTIVNSRLVKGLFKGEW